jgi:rubrerythrin
MTVAQFFDRAIAWERAAEGLYSGLAEMFAADLSARDIWLRMAADEAFHVTLLEAGLARLTGDDRARALMPYHMDVVDSIERELAEIAGETVVTLDDAYELANRLESSEINSVFQVLVLDKLEPDTRAALVRSQFEEHVARLTEMRQVFTREERRARSRS